MIRLVNGILRHCQGVLTIGEEAEANVQVTAIDKVESKALLWLYVVDAHGIDAAELAKMVRKVPESIITGRPNSNLVALLQDQNITINVYPSTPPQQVEEQKIMDFDFFDNSVASGPEINHVTTTCPSPDHKFLLIFLLYKLCLINGKSIAYFDSPTPAFKFKMLLDRFHISSFVVFSDLPRRIVNSVYHFHEIGEIDCLILLNSGYSRQPAKVQNLSCVIFHDLPKCYNDYKDKVS